MSNIMTWSEIWPWITLAAIVTVWFIWWEGRAFNHPDKSWTLSRTTAFIAEKWPPFIAIYGVIVGGAAVHFFWHWCPSGLPVNGG